MASIHRLLMEALSGLLLLWTGSATAVVLCTPVTPDDVRHVVAAAPDTAPPAPGACGTLALVGEIRPGDHDALRTLLVRSGPYAARLDTVSPGGDAMEAMRIGRLVRDRLLATVAPQYRPDRGTGAFPGRCAPEADCTCAGACFLVWAAGIERQGEHVLLRRLGDPEVAAYLADVEVPVAYAATLASLPAGTARAISEERLEADLEGLTPTARGRIAAACGEYSQAEAIDRLALTSRKRMGNARLTPQEERRLALLEEKTAAVDRCRTGTLTAERVRRWRDSPPP